MEIGRQFEMDVRFPVLGIGVTVALAQGGGKSAVEMEQFSFTKSNPTTTALHGGELPSEGASSSAQQQHPGVKTVAVRPPPPMHGCTRWRGTSVVLNISNIRDALAGGELLFC